MKYLLTVAIGLIVLTGLTNGRPQTTSQADHKTTPVLVELFTSEGCSSCPPADDFLARLNREQPLPGVTVIGIEEHVDYWNHDGWVDPYSSPEWTSRQVDYVEHFKDASPYTPQCVIDGQQSFVGTHAQQIVEAIRQNARQPQPEMAVTLETPADGALKVHVRVGKLSPAPNDSVDIWLALAEKNVASSVDRGENAGKELRHSAVLRSLKKLGVAHGSGDAAFEGSAELKLNRQWKSENVEAIVFAQKRKSKRILGVALAGSA